MWSSSCRFGREVIDSEKIATAKVGQFVDLEHPLTCSGYIVQWHFCYYTSNTQDSNDNRRIYFRVYRNESSNQLYRVHQVTVNTEVSDLQLNNSFFCTSRELDSEQYLKVEAGDYLAVYLPTLVTPLQVVGYAAPQLLLYRDGRRFPDPFTRDTIPFSELDKLAGAFLHLQADIGKTYHTYSFLTEITIIHVIILSSFPG